MALSVIYVMVPIFVYISSEVEAGSKSCDFRGCSYAGNGKDRDNSGFQCSCLVSCIALDRCCDDYHTECGSPIRKQPAE